MLCHLYLSVEAIHSLQFLLVELPCMLEVMSLNLGIVFLIHLSIHMHTKNLQNKRNGEVGNADVAVESW